MIEKENISKTVTDAFMDCLFKEDEPHDGYILVEGITNKFGFHPQRLERKRETIKEILSMLPNEFKDTSLGGEGGWSFLNLCVLQDGYQWTGMHRVQEQLMCIAIGLNLMEYLLPREMWPALPGSVPYVMIKEV